MRVKNNIVTFIVLLVAVLFVLQHSEGKANYAVFESTIDIEVDGKPIKLTKRYSCSAETFSKAGGDRFSEVRQNSSAVSHKLPSGEYIIAAVPWSCGRVAVDERDGEGKPLSYKITQQLPKDFLPFIAIADKGPVPDRVIVYASNKAYTAKAARIKFNGIALTVAPRGTGETPEDDFGWFLTEGGGGGPFYMVYVIEKAAIFPELRGLLAEYTSDYTSPIRLLHGGEQPWFSKFNQYYGALRKVFPDRKWGNPLNGGNTHPSPYEERASSFVFEKNTDFSSDTLSLYWNKDYEGMKIYYRMPYEYFSNYTAIQTTKNFSFRLPGGGTYHRPKSKSGDGSDIVYDNGDKNIYKLGIGNHQTLRVKGMFMGHYNYK